MEQDIGKLALAGAAHPRQKSNRVRPSSLMSDAIQFLLSDFFFLHFVAF